MLRLSLAALAALVYLACAKKDPLAGGYDDVENPAIRVSLLDTLSRPYGAGEIRLYARYQNPAKDPIPLMELNLAPGTAVEITDSAMIAAMGRAQVRGTPWPHPDSVEFNLLASAPAGETPGGEAFQGDFLLVKNGDGTRRFLRRAQGATLAANAKGILEVTPVMGRPVLDQRGRVGERGRQLDLKSVFIPGSPYRAGLQPDGSFTLARMAQGNYEVKAISGDAKIYSAADSLNTGLEYFPSDWSEADLIWIE